MFEIKESGEGRGVIVAQAPVVASTAQDLKTVIRDLLSRGCKDVVIDLAEVEDVDSIGISVFISAHVSLAKAGGRLTLVNVGEDLQSLFLGMRLGDHFEIRAAQS